jgi:4'-phosphopantetheinyl transferase EntD
MHLEQLAAALASIAPHDVVTGVRSIDAADVTRLAPVERAAVANAVDRRRHEFASGRVLLRTLLGRDAAIAVGPTRAPVLPPGWVGSLAHDRTVAVAAVARAGDVVALGVDVEPDVELSADLARIILRADDGDVDAHLAFTLKEAAYKAWSNSGGGMLDHHDVRIAVTSVGFTATVIEPGVVIDGRHVSIGGKHLALAIIRRS